MIISTGWNNPAGGVIDLLKLTVASNATKLKGLM